LPDLGYHVSDGQVRQSDERNVVPVLDDIVFDVTKKCWELNFRIY